MRLVLEASDGEASVLYRRGLDLLKTATQRGHKLASQDLTLTLTLTLTLIGGHKLASQKMADMEKEAYAQLKAENRKNAFVHRGTTQAASPPRST